MEKGVKSAYGLLGSSLPLACFFALDGLAHNTMATTLVWLDDEKSVAAKLVDAVSSTLSGSDGDAFRAKAQSLVEQKDFAALAIAVAEHSDALFEASAAKAESSANGHSDTKNDAVACFNVVSQMLMQRVDVSAIPPVVDAICSAVASGSSAGTDLLRLRVLSLVYNHLAAAEPTRPLQCRLFKAIAELAAQSGNLALLESSLAQRPEDIVAPWGASLTQTRDVMKRVAELLASEDAVAAQRWRVAFLRSFQGSSDLGDARDAAAQAVIECVKRVGEVDEDANLYRLAAVQQLEGDEQFGKLFELLRIFVDDKYAAYAKFYAYDGNARF